VRKLAIWICLFPLVVIATPHLAEEPNEQRDAIGGAELFKQLESQFKGLPDVEPPLRLNNALTHGKIWPTKAPVSLMGAKCVGSGGKESAVILATDNLGFALTVPVDGPVSEWFDAHKKVVEAATKAREQIAILVERNRRLEKSDKPEDKETIKKNRGEIQKLFAETEKAYIDYRNKAFALVKKECISDFPKVLALFKENAKRNRKPIPDELTIEDQLMACFNPRLPTTPAPGSGPRLPRREVVQPNNAVYAQITVDHQTLASNYQKQVWIRYSRKGNELLFRNALRNQQGELEETLCRATAVPPVYDATNGFDAAAKAFVDAEKA